MRTNYGLTNAANSGIILKAYRWNIMFENERANQIMEFLRTRNKATISELATALFASESTIRRDLTEMQESGLVARYHGGVILLDGTNEVSLFVRAEQDSAEKDRCADIAIAHGLNGAYANANTIFIDNSSTCLALARKLDFTNKTIITNGLQIALQLSQKPNIRLIVPGGTVHTSTRAVIGSLAIRMLGDLDIDLMLSSCAGLNERGAFELSLETSQLKQVAIAQSKHKILLATSNKFFTTASYRVNELEAYDCLYTTADNGVTSALAQKKIKIFNALPDTKR